MPDFRDRANEWLQNADAMTQEELSSLPPEALEERFYTELTFGTAGLRGKIGAGTNNMNMYVVSRAAQGLAAYLLSIEGAKERGVAIAYDSRKFSQEFALKTALVLAHNDIHAFLFEELRAVPQLSFAIRHLNCIAGVVITASHNPSIYNGYKVYWEHGGQLGPEQADAVYAAMQGTPYFGIEAMEKSEALCAGLLTMIGKEVDEAYYAATLTLLQNPTPLQQYGKLLKIVYTPLFGTGHVPVMELLKRAGAQQVYAVEEQAQPNGAFPSLEAPNPENPDVYALAIAHANGIRADVILATDPDADRMGVALRDNRGEFVLLTGNQIGVLLLHHILSYQYSQGALPANAVAVKSIVSTTMADAICARYQVACVNVLTGFRFISEIVDQCERTGEGAFLFGFEESYGFLAGGFSRDKDGICAAMLFSEFCADCCKRGCTPYQALMELYEAYGFYKEHVLSYALEGKAGIEKIDAAMQALRDHPLGSLANMPVQAVEDYHTGITSSLTGEQDRALSLPRTNMLRLLLQGGSWLVVRPSGTEPKLKLYAGVHAKTEQAAASALQALIAAADSHVSALLI